MITTVGKNLVRDMIIGSNPGSITRVEIGTDNTAPVVTDTALLGDTYGDTATETEPSSVSAMFQITLGTGDGNGTGTRTYQEVGLLTGASGTLLSRQIYKAKTKNNTIAFKVQVIVEVTS